MSLSTRVPSSWRTGNAARNELRSALSHVSAHHTLCLFPSLSPSLDWLLHRNKLDLSISIAFGSALQISLFVVPFLVLLSYARDTPMHLLFSKFEVLSVSISCVLSWMIVSGGQTNWLFGFVLVSAYIALALGFFYIPAAH
jgi:hypothetical protein